MLWKAVLSAVLLVSVTVMPAAAATPAAGWYSSLASASAQERQVFNLVNAERSRRGLSKLAWNDRVARVARDYSAKMAREGFFDHYDSDGNSVLERAERSNLGNWRRIGENLFSCDPTNDFSRLAVREWLRSPSHRDNMLERDWRESGIGIAFADNGSIYITQVFIE